MGSYRRGSLVSASSPSLRSISCPSSQDSNRPCRFLPFPRRPRKEETVATLSLTLTSVSVSMASGESSGRAAASDSNSFDFGSDDVLCPYGDYAAQDPSIGKRSDLAGTVFSFLDLVSSVDLLMPRIDVQTCRIGSPIWSVLETGREF